jgi:hypothetical protein
LSAARLMTQPAFGSPGLNSPASPSASPFRQKTATAGGLAFIVQRTASATPRHYGRTILFARRLRSKAAPTAVGQKKKGRGCQSLPSPIFAANRSALTHPE